MTLGSLSNIAKELVDERQSIEVRPEHVQHGKLNVWIVQDTRHTRKLLTFFGLTCQLYSFHEHNEHSKEAQVSLLHPMP